MSSSGGALRRLERYLGWLAIPQIALLVVTLQALGFVMVILVNPIYRGVLALQPDRVAAGEYWRLITWLALPLSDGPIFMLFALMMLWFVLNTIEAQWGAFKTTLYVLVSLVATVGFSLLTGMEVRSAADFESTLFLAAAALFPDLEVALFGILPVKLKWLAAVSAAFIAWRFFASDLWGRLYLVTMYFNFILFFGPGLVERVRLWNRRRSYQAKIRRE